MIKIKLEETTSVEMEMSIEGSTNSPAEMRFSVLAEGMRYSFETHEVRDGIYEVNFPKMLGKITEGQYPIEVEVMIDGKHFVPLTDTITFTKEIKPQVSLSENKIENKPSQPVVKMKTIKVTEEQIKIHTLDDLMEQFAQEIKSSDAIDTVAALKCLRGMATRKSLTEGKLRILPKNELSENEILAVIEIVSDYGADIDDLTMSMKPVAKTNRIYEKVINLLSQKGVSKKKIIKILS